MRRLATFSPAALLGALHPCPLCGARPAGATGCCRPCRSAALAPGGDGSAVWLGPFRGPLRRAVHALKYRHGTRLASWLGPELAGLVRARGWRVEVVTAVPIDTGRRRLRGYDQAELLARSAASALGLPYRRLLRRSRRTLQQAGLGRDARSVNVAGAFAARGAVAGRVLLVDDVLTTGATTRACAAALRAGGAGAVYVAVVGRA